MKVYKLRTRFPADNWGLSNQLCLLINAIDSAIQVLSLGSGVILKPNIDRILWDGNTLTDYPSEGYHRLGEKFPYHPKKMEVWWKYKTQINYTSFIEDDQIHWLDSIPDAVYIYIEFFRPQHDGERLMKPDEVFDFTEMNRLLRPFRVKLFQADGWQGNPLGEMFNPNTPRLSTMFRTIASKIRFHPEFINRVKASIPIKQKMSVVHLRNERDAVEFWSQSTKTPIDEYDLLLHKKYIECIDKHIQPLSDVIVLTFEKENNPVIDWMREKGYVLHMLPCITKERELSAIYDMIASTFCNDVFIGAYNFNKCSGSSFSFFVSSLTPDSVKKVFLDLDNINDPFFIKECEEE